MTDHFDTISSNILEKELGRVRYRTVYIRTIRSTLFILITIAAFALLVATLLLPVVQVYSSSMSPTIPEDSIVFCIKESKPDQGDVLAFYYNNKILIRRVAGLPGHTVEIGPSGHVVLDGSQLEETYVKDMDRGNCDREGAYAVPGGQYYVLGDNRRNATDSRQVIFGCISQEDFIGRVVFCVWPLSAFGFVD